VHALQVDVKFKVSRLSVEVGNTSSLVLDYPKVTVVATAAVAIEDEGLVATSVGIGVDLAEVELVDPVNKIHDLVAIGAELRAELKDVVAATTEKRILISPTV
jgi:hypothetical protein